MGTSHAESAASGQPRPPTTLLESFSPYGSRKVTVEYDGLTTAAYLRDDTSAISATWIANHRPAPPSTDQARLDAGRAPLMPAARTKHPAGRPPLQADALEALWFEEGERGRDPGARAAARGHRGLVRLRTAACPATAAT